MRLKRKWIAYYFSRRERLIHKLREIRFWWNNVYHWPMRIENVFSRYRFTKLDVNYNRLFPDEAGNGMEHRNRVEERKKKEDMFFSIYYRLNRPVLATATSLSAFFDFHSHSPKQCLA